jgi:hypothetical protein
VFFFNDIGDFPISVLSRKGKFEISGLISGISDIEMDADDMRYYLDQDPDVPPRLRLLLQILPDWSDLSQSDYQGI